MAAQSIADREVNKSKTLWILQPIPCVMKLGAHSQGMLLVRCGCWRCYKIDAADRKHDDGILDQKLHFDKQEKLGCSRLLNKEVSRLLKIKHHYGTNLKYVLGESLDVASRQLGRPERNVLLNDGALSLKMINSLDTVRETIDGK